MTSAEEFALEVFRECAQGEFEREKITALIRARDAEHAQEGFCAEVKKLLCMREGESLEHALSAYRDHHRQEVAFEHAQERERLLGIFGDYDHEITDVETAEAIWNEMRARECRKDERIVQLEKDLVTQDEEWAEELDAETKIERQRAQAAVAAAIGGVIRLYQDLHGQKPEDQLTDPDAFVAAAQKLITPAHESALNKLLAATASNSQGQILAALADSADKLGVKVGFCWDTTKNYESAETWIRNMLADARRGGSQRDAGAGGEA